MKYCKGCGNELADSSTPRRCRKCAQKATTAKREATCLARYGATNPMYADKLEVQKKLRNN